MASVSQLRAKLRSINTTLSGNTLLEGLEAAHAAAESRVIQSASAHGVTAVYGPGNSSDPDNEATEYLLTLYESCLQDIGGTPTDAQLFAAMMSRLPIITEIQNDFSRMRDPALLS